MAVGDVRRLQQLDAERTRLKQLLAEEKLDEHALKAALGKLKTPFDRRDAVALMMAHGPSQRRPSSPAPILLFSTFCLSRKCAL